MSWFNRAVAVATTATAAAKWSIILSLSFLHESCRWSSARSLVIISTGKSGRCCSVKRWVVVDLILQNRELRRISFDSSVELRDWISNTRWRSSNRGISCQYRRHCLCRHCLFRRHRLCLGSCLNLSTLVRSLVAANVEKVLSTSTTMTTIRSRCCLTNGLEGGVAGALGITDTTASFNGVYSCNRFLSSNLSSNSPLE